MVKTFKSAFAFVLVVAMLLTSMSMGAIAETVKPGYPTKAAAIPWTGENVPTARMINPEKTSAVNGSLPTNKNKHLVVMEYVDGLYGKVADDLVYKVYDYSLRTESDLSQYGDFNVGLAAGSDAVVEFSFALGGNNSAVKILTRRNVSTSVNSKGYIQDDAFLKISSAEVSHGTSKSSIDLDIRKWYNVAVVMDFENGDTATEYTYKVYINGVESLRWTESVVYTGLRLLRIGTYNDTTADVGTVYFDNINPHVIDSASTFVPADAALSTLTSNNSAISVNGENISVPTGTTVGTLKQALVSSGANDNIRFYNSDYTAELLDGDSATNINIVVASPRVYSATVTKENTYAYYTTAKAYKTFDGINLDASSMGTEIASGSQTLVNVVDGGYGKYDKVYEFSSVSDGSVQSKNGYHPEPFAIISEGSAKQRVLEFAFMLPEGSRGIRLIAHCWGCAHGGNKEPSVGITPTGVKVLYTVPNVIPYEFDYNKWYNIALVFPGKTDSASCGATLTAYVNGEKIGETPCDEVLGLRRLRVAAISTADEQRVFAYLDNIRNNDTSYANAAYDADDAIIASGYDTDAKADKFYITEETTVSAIKAAISDIKEDTTVYVLNADGAIMNDADIVSNGCTVAVAAMHDTASVRTVSYYDIENIAGKFVVKTPEYTVTGSNASVAFDTINKTGSAVTVTAIIAVYNPDGSLKTVTTVPCTTGAGLNGSFAEGISAAYSAATDEVPSDKVKFMIWTSTESDITPKVKSAVLVD